MKKLKIFGLIMIFGLVMVSTTIISATEFNSTDDDNVDYSDIHSYDKNVKTESNTPKTITLTNKNFNQYVTNGEFNEEVSDGDTIDVDGMFDSDKFSLNVNKSLNFISSKNNSYINLYTQSTGDYGEATGGQITFGHGASGSNITNLYFYNTRVTFTNVSNVNVNNISVIDYEAVIGSGTGHFIIGGQSDNVTIANSYFYTKDNGAHSTAVFSGCSNILFENNTIIGVGGLGNLVYLNTFNVEEGASHSNFIIRNNVIDASQAGPQITCFAICLTGSNILIDNNTIDYKGYNICPIYGGQGVLENITIQNNNLKTVILGNSGIIEVKYINNTKVINNTIGALIVSKSSESTHHCEIYNNTIGTLRLEADDCIVEGNTLATVNNTGNNNIINSNTISTSSQNYTITTTGENTTITNNKLASTEFYGDESINGYATLENNTNTTRKIVITDNNLDVYASYNETFKKYTLNGSLLQNARITINSSIIKSLLINNTPDASKTNFIPMIFESIIAPNLCEVSTERYTNITFSNIYLPQATLAPINFYSYFTNENCTFLAGLNLFKSTKVRNITTINVTLLNETSNTIILNKTTNGFIIDNFKNFDNIFDTTTNKLLSTISDNTNLIVRGYNATYTTPIIIDKPINITSYDAAVWNADITFMPGSEGSIISGMNISGVLNIQTNNISVFNNTIKKVVMDNCINCNIFNNTFSTEETAIEMTGVFNSNITNNIINITADNTMTIDSDSAGNIIQNNVLVANNNYNINSISGNIQENTIINNTPAVNTTITIDLQNSTLINTEIPINITVTSDNGLVDNGYVVILANGVEQTNATLNNGKLETTITPTQKGINTVKAWYFPSNYYIINSQTKQLNVTSIKTTIRINDINPVKVGENVTVTTTIKDSSGNNVNEGIVIFTIKNDTFTTNVTNGVASVNITTIESYKDAELSVQYTGGQTLDDSTNKTTLSLNPGEVIMTITQEYNDDKITLTITVTDINGNKVSSGYIRLTGDVTAHVELQDAMLTYDINKPTSDMTINATFRLNNAFETKTEQITINAPRTTITQIPANITGLINNTITITATIIDANGTNINEGTVTFTDTDENIIAQINVTDGTATTTITSDEEKNITLTITYKPNTNEYLESTNTTTISIQKPTTQLNITDVNLTAGKTVTLTATLTDQLGNNINGGKVVFKINGKTVKDTNGKIVYAKVVDGVAQVDYEVPTTYADKELNITATYTGTSTYNKETTTITRTATKPAPTLTLTPITNDVQSGSTIKIEAKVSTGDNPITTGKIIFKLNGKTLKDENGKVIYAKVDANGTVSLDYNIGNLKANTYNLTATFISTGYDKLEANTTINVVKA